MQQKWKCRRHRCSLVQLGRATHWGTGFDSRLSESHLITLLNEIDKIEHGCFSSTEQVSECSVLKTNTFSEYSVLYFKTLSIISFFFKVNILQLVSKADYMQDSSVDWYSNVPGVSKKYGVESIDILRMVKHSNVKFLDIIGKNFV